MTAVFMAKKKRTHASGESFIEFLNEIYKHI